MISANSQQIVVKIKGNTGGGKYDGTEHGVEAIPSPMWSAAP